MSDNTMSLKTKIFIGFIIVIILFILIFITIYFAAIKPAGDKALLSGAGAGTGTELVSVPITPQNQVMGRYIKLSKPGIPGKRDNCLHLMEIKVFSTVKGPNIIRSDMKVSKSSVLKDELQFPNVSLIDNDDNTMIHTSCENIDQWIILDLGYTAPISEIILVSRQNCCGNQMNGVVLEITNNNGVVVYNANPIKSPNGSIISNNKSDDFYKFYKYSIPSLMPIGYDNF
jgi:hypothetical protein